jgi:16S rRNA (uracil1498-N3)-methyltransferase
MTNGTMTIAQFSATHYTIEMPRFYCPRPLFIGARLSLPEPIIRHVQVLRLAPGDNFTLFNGEGGEYIATLTALDRRSAEAEVKTHTPREAELPYALTLAQALPEGSKMDSVIEKAVELGAAAIQPLAAQRSVPRLSADRAAKRHAHWQGIVQSASEQCGRNRLAHLAELAGFDDWIDRVELHRRLLLSPRAGQSLSDWARHHPPQAVTLVIGPEGGFTGQEEAAALERGALAVSLGARVLRTETAGMAAMAALNAVWGEM